MINLDNVLFKRGDNTVFDQLSFTVHAGQHVGIVGRNGVGKSTLFRIIQGELDVDTGEVSLPEGWRISHMRQEVTATDRPALAYVLDGHTELRRIERQLAQAEAADDGERLAYLHAQFQDIGGHEAPAQAATILHGLGFAGSVQNDPFDSFSGGWRIRLNLAQALMRPADLLLLDEPTNHLDMETTIWLEHHLARFEGTLLIIAHDRAFLDAATNHTLHLSHGRGRVYRGGYSQFERTRTEELERDAKVRTKRAKEIEHIESFVNRFRAKASKAKQVQSRIKTLERLRDTATLRAESPYRVQFPDPKKISNPVLGFRELVLGYEGQPVLKELAQTILPGARIGVLGANGAGKSTLLKCLVGALQPMAGELVRGQHATTGYFSQHQMETLAAEQTPLAQMSAIAEGLREQAVRDLLGGWGFDGDMVKRPVETLSGGEKARLVLAMIAHQAPALLVLDEPTNHLDLDIREALAAALQTYSDALVLVSHDRSLLSATCDELWLVAEGRLARYDASVDDYSALQQAAFKESSDTRAPSHTRRAERQARAASRQRLQALRKETRDLEQRLEQATEELSHLERKLADPDVYHSTPTDELNQLMADAGKRRGAVEQLESEWLAAAERLESAMNNH